MILEESLVGSPLVQIVWQRLHATAYLVPDKVFLNRFNVNHGMLARLPIDRHCQGTTKFRQWTQRVIAETMVWQGCPQMAIALNNICCRQATAMDII